MERWCACWGDTASPVHRCMSCTRMHCIWHRAYATLPTTRSRVFVANGSCLPTRRPRGIALRMRFDSERTLACSRTVCQRLDLPSAVSSCSGEGMEVWYGWIFRPELPMTPLLRAKLALPPVQAMSLSRPRLLDLMSEALQRPLTLLCAPAGFGKTSL